MEDTLITKPGARLDNSDILEIIEHDYQRAKEYHEDWISRMQNWIDTYEGKPYNNEIQGRSSIVWTTTKKYGESLVSNIVKPFIATDEIVDLDPRTEQDVYKTKIYKKLANHFWGYDFDNNKFLKTFGNVLVKEGTVVTRVGWEKVDKTKRVVVPTMNEKMAAAIIQRGGKINQLKNGQFEIINENIVVNRPTAKVVRNEDVYVDPTASSMDEVKFIIHEYVVSISDMKKQPEVYDKNAVPRLEKIIHDLNDRKDDDWIERYDDDHGESGEENPTDFEFIDISRKKVRIYEYWGEYDMDGDGITEPIVAVVAKPEEGDENVLVKMKKNPFPFGMVPFIFVPLLENEFSIYGRGLADVVSDEQKVMTSIVRGMIDNMANSNNGIKFFKKGALDHVNMNRLKRGEPYVEINATDSINTAVMDGNFNPIPTTVFNFLAIMEQQSEALTGVTKMLQGIPGTEMKSSTSNFAATMSQGQIRLLDITANVTNGLKRMFMMWIYMCMEYLSYDEIQDITGISIPELKVKETKKLEMEFGLIDPQTGEPAVDEETYNKAMLLIIQEVQDMFEKRDVKFDIKLKVGTDGLKQIRIQEILMLMQQAAPMMQTGAVPGEAIKMLLAELADNMDKPDIAAMIKEYQPQPDPMQQAMAQAQVQQVQANAAKDAALAKNAEARTKESMVKAEKEAMSIDADVANKYADVAQKMASVDQGDMKTKADAYSKIKQANQPKTQPKTGGKQ